MPSHRSSVSSGYSPSETHDEQQCYAVRPIIGAIHDCVVPAAWRFTQLCDLVRFAWLCNTHRGLSSAFCSIIHIIFKKTISLSNFTCLLNLSYSSIHDHFSFRSFQLESRALLHHSSLLRHSISSVLIHVSDLLCLAVVDGCLIKTANRLFELTLWLSRSATICMIQPTSRFTNDSISGSEKVRRLDKVHGFHQRYRNR